MRFDLNESQAKCTAATKLYLLHSLLSLGAVPAPSDLIYLFPGCCNFIQLSALYLPPSRYLLMNINTTVLVKNIFQVSLSLPHDLCMVQKYPTLLSTIKRILMLPMGNCHSTWISGSFWNWRKWGEIFPEFFSQFLETIYVYIHKFKWTQN